MSNKTLLLLYTLESIYYHVVCIVIIILLNIQEYLHIPEWG